MALAEHDHVVEELAAQCTHKAFDVTILPWGSWSNADLMNAEVVHPYVECPAVDPVAITDQAENGVVGADGLDYLLGGPFCVGVRGYVDVEDAAAFQREEDEYIQHLEGYGWNGQKVDGDCASEMRAQEDAPTRGGRSTGATSRLRHVLRDCVFADVMAELGELTRDAPATPERVVEGHALDKRD